MARRGAITLFSNKGRHRAMKCGELGSRFHRAMKYARGNRDRNNRPAANDGGCLINERLARGRYMEPP